MKLLYKPFAVIASMIAARIGRSVFKTLWSRIDETDPPDPSTYGASLPKVVGAAALEAATMASVSAAADRASAKAFHHLIGIWPGDDSEEKDR